MAESETLTEQERSAIRDWIGGRDIVDLVHGLQSDAQRLREALDRSTDDHGEVCKELHAAKAKLAALEAKETARNAARLAELASGTVSRTEYDAMVKQRDTIRQERTEARDQLRYAIELVADALEVWLDERDFYELMQAYRHSPILPLEHVGKAFEAVKAAILEQVRNPG